MINPTGPIYDKLKAMGITLPPVAAPEELREALELPRIAAASPPIQANRNP